MRYHSTSNTEQNVGLHDAVLRSVAPDGGVYMPDFIPLIPRALFNHIPEMSLHEIAFVVGNTLFGTDIPAETINSIIRETLTFDIPLVKVDDNIFALELFHGPTGSFKDVGARFMARLVKHLTETETSTGPTINVFVATSGDTGCAVSHGFAGIKGLRVFVFHPKGNLLRVPHSSFRSPSFNIIPVGLRGSFDDCQAIVRRIYNDPELNRRMNITSANSINIARLLPQTFYYFHAYARLLSQCENPGKIVISTPCGNLGNLTAAIFSLQLGLPIDRILAAGHDNERLWGVIMDQRLTLNDFNSNAMSTNLARINDLISANKSLADIIECHTYNDSLVAEQIVNTYRRSAYLMDRNSAMACRALGESLRPGESGIFLATAHPEKYAVRLRELLGNDILAGDTAYGTDRTIPSETILPALFPAVKRFLLEQDN